MFLPKNGELMFLPAVLVKPSGDFWSSKTSFWTTLEGKASRAKHIPNSHQVPGGLATLCVKNHSVALATETLAQCSFQ